MSLPAIKFLSSAAVSVANGSKTVTLTGAVNAHHVSSGTAVFIGGHQVVEAVSGTAETGGTSTITLRYPWPHANVTNGPLVAFNTFEGLAGIIDHARNSSNITLALLDKFEELVTATSSTINVSINGTDVSMVPYGYLSNAVQTLVNDANGAVNTLNTLQSSVATLQSTVDNIQASLDADKQASAASAALAQSWAESLLELEPGKYSAKKHAQDAGTHSSDAQGHASTAQTARNDAQAALAAVNAVFDSFDDRYLGAKTSDPTLDNDGQALQVGQIYYNSTTKHLRFYNGASWDSPSATAVAAANQAEQDRIRAQQFANHPVDTPIPGTEADPQYSALHHRAKTQELAGGTAPDSQKLAGKLPSHYATAEALASVRKLTIIGL